MAKKVARKRKQRPEPQLIEGHKPRTGAPYPLRSVALFQVEVGKVVEVELPKGQLNIQGVRQTGQKRVYDVVYVRYHDRPVETFKFTAVAGQGELPDDIAGLMPVAWGCWRNPDAHEMVTVFFLSGEKL